MRYFKDVSTLTDDDLAAEGKLCIDLPDLNVFLALCIKRGVDISRISAPKGKVQGFSYNGGRTRICTYQHLMPGESADEERQRAYYKLIKDWFGFEPKGFSEISSKLLIFDGVKSVWKPKTKLINDKHQFSEKTKALRASIYGSRGEVLKWKGFAPHGLIEYDIPSAFPRAASGVLPCGTGAIDFRGKTHGVRLQYAEVDVPYMPVGPLPVKSRKIGTFYPVDCKIFGWWWDIEIEQALSMGCTVKTHKQWIFRAGRPLKPLMDKLIDFRDAHPEYDGLSKLIANQAIGKLGMQPITTRWTVNPENPKGWTLVSPKLGLCRIAKPRKEFPWARPAAYAYIQARVRVQLLKFVLANFTSVISYHCDGAILDAAKSYDSTKLFRQKKTWPKSVYFMPWSSAYYIRGVDFEDSKASGLGSWQPGIEKMQLQQIGFEQPQLVPVCGPTKPQFRDRNWHDNYTTTPKKGKK